MNTHHARTIAIAPVYADRVVAETPLVKIGAFRCDREYPDFGDTGPVENYCMVFPRTSVRIQFEGAAPFVANSCFSIFYNSRQSYRRFGVDREGDRSDWFGFDQTLLREVVRDSDPAAADRDDRIFARARVAVTSELYRRQRELFEAGRDGTDTLALEEGAILLLHDVLSAPDPARPKSGPPVTARQREFVYATELVLSRFYAHRIVLSELAARIGVSVYHLCRSFHAIVGQTIHQYRVSLRVRAALDLLDAPDAKLSDLALQLGFSHHSHFTMAFHRHFGISPSEYRRRLNAAEAMPETVYRARF